MRDPDADKKEALDPAGNEVTTNHNADEAGNSEQPEALGLDDFRQDTELQKKNTRILAGIFGVLLFLVLGVIFVLPNFVSPPDPQSGSVVIVPPRDTSNPADNQVSPFEEAQLLRQRENAQTVLADLLELQETLEEKEVEQWASEEITTVFDLAAQGDTAYREQRFVQAQALYQQGLDILQTLQADIPNVFEQYMAEGNDAILAGSPETAEQSFSIAVMLDPDSAEAVTGYDRSLLLPQVLEVLAEGEQLHQANLLEQAREKYREALAIDPDHEKAGSQLANVNQDILDRNFTAAMSEGFSALADDNPEMAKAAFTRALKLKPQSEEAASALEQTESQMTMSAINIHLQAAASHEAEEQWQQALDEYTSALTIDPNLVQAQEGQSRTRSRTNLDTYLESINAEPLRLAEESVYDQAINIYNEANRIPAPGPRLQSQLQSLRANLEKVIEPVQVQLSSDGKTEVTVYQVGVLGQFTDHALNLTPGNYVAVGVREGFRDVREEFTVPINGQLQVVTIQCTDEI